MMEVNTDANVRRTTLAVLAGVLLSLPSLTGPIPPAAGQSDSSAVPLDDPAIIAWATGWTRYEVGANCDPEWQTPERGLGVAAGDSFDVVCLGESGRITLTFDVLVTDRLGPDFAVFENAINDTFLELAYVEVSSNGEHFVRFPNRSLTPEPVGPYGALDPADVSGLAGKYRQGFGTPFDLALLTGASPHLDVSAVRFVRLIDVSGNGAALDSADAPIYDPYPSVGSAGFDLDAVAVLRRVSPEPPIEAWRRQYFGKDANEASASDSGDPDRDGRENLLEYCVGSHPLQADLDPVLTIVRSSDRAGEFCWVEFRRSAELPDAELLLQFAHELSSTQWRGDLAAYEETFVDGPDGSLTVRARLNHRIEAPSNLFVRLHARRP